MKPSDSSEASENLGTCPRCGNQEVLLFYSEKVEGYYVGECQQCGAYSEIMSAKVFQQYRPQKPRKTGDREEPWVTRLSPRRELTFKDKRPAMISRIFKKIKEK